MDREQTPKKWIIMLYLAADNNLSEEGVWSLTEIQDVVRLGKLKEDIGIIVLFDTNVKGRKTQVFEFGFEKEKEGAENLSAEKTQVLGKRLGAGTDVKEWLGKSILGWLEDEKVEGNLEDANSPALLTGFIKQTDEKHRAENYALILSGHGSGAIGDFLGQGEDNVAGSDYKGMSIPTLGQAIEKAGVTIEILGMDSCLMSMAEVCFELPPQVKFLVGSEGNGPLTGWPFKEILLALHNRGTGADNQSSLKAEDIANAILDEYIRYYSEYFVAGTSVDMALCDLSETKKKALKNELRLLADELKEKIKDNTTIRDKVILAHWRAQSYKAEQYTDLWDFCNLLQEGLGDTEIIKYCDKVKEAIKSIVLKCRYYGVRFQHSNGLSVYFPWKDSRELDAYLGEGTVFRGLHFAQESNWGKFLKEYVYATRREMRGVIFDKGKFVLQPGQPDNIEIVTASGKTGELNLLEDRELPPDGRELPPDGRELPPDGRELPPDGRELPPDGRGMLARLANMKNSPIGFLRNRDTGEEIRLLEKKN